MASSTAVSVSAEETEISRDERRQDGVACLRERRRAVLVIEQIGRIAKAEQSGLPKAEEIELTLKANSLRGTEQPRAKRRPGRGHETPALRPGVSRLPMGQFGRLAPLNW